MNQPKTPQEALELVPEFGPKFSSVSTARKAVDSHGGTDVVRERLARGWG
jgi:hypothetical protein